ncbi:hypothetical protein Daes_3177 [Pseudodesulfovibrio aespoeensis Aspo-2]|uniref:Uncharacterized protein n=1 Tax=Pseudodesulfovibrio aespoeensis (strain ATCC 700646 / DSM 10631 / Aspo-2) TaxID=643562 RepID=E6VR85_PSEA9|nr:hypothetical protein Daes_3177 [Pseudodesulfovibrio aespoeensis Aspo-2]
MSTPVTEVVNFFESSVIPPGGYRYQSLSAKALEKPLAAISAAVLAMS